MNFLTFGPDFEYFPNASMTSLTVKDCYFDFAVSIFQDSGVCISVDGKGNLGATLGSPSFITSFVSQKILL